MRAVSFFGAVGLFTTGGTFVAAGRGTDGAWDGTDAVWGLTKGDVPTRGGGKGDPVGVPGCDVGIFVVAGACGLGGSGVETEGTLELPSPGLGGKVMRTVSRLPSAAPEAPERGGREIRTVSFLGSSGGEEFVGSAMII